MKQVCIYCERASSGGNLWCLESYCSLDSKPLVLDYGETLADLTISKTVAVLHASTIYEATRGEEKVLLKVAHPGFHERLKREANFLVRSQLKQQHPMLPTLLAAHEQADVGAYPYGKTVLQGNTLYYTIFKHEDGDLLRGMLLKNPQPWFQHAGWIAISLADVLGMMHQNQVLHLALSPDVVLVRFDKERIPRVLLLDLGAVTQPQDVAQQWQPEFVPTAYIAPELIRPKDRKVGAFSDVYGVGLILYEMLAGRPVYDYRLRADEMIRNDVLNTQPAQLNRSDLKDVPQLTMQAISKEYQQRPREIVTLGGELLKSFPPVPKEKPEKQFNWRTFAIVVGAAMAIALLLIFAVSVGDVALEFMG